MWKFNRYDWKQERNFIITNKAIYNLKKKGRTPSLMQLSSAGSRSRKSAGSLRARTPRASSLFSTFLSNTTTGSRLTVATSSSTSSRRSTSTLRKTTYPSSGSMSLILRTSRRRVFKRWHACQAKRYPSLNSEPPMGGRPHTGEGLLQVHLQVVHLYNRLCLTSVRGP